MGFMAKFRQIMGLPDEEEFDESADIIPNTVESDEERPRKGGDVLRVPAQMQLQVVLMKPERLEDASGVADHLKQRRTVVLNLENASKDARRLLDFLTGVAYALDGQIKMVSNGTYIITPVDVDVMGDLLDELENSGAFY